MKDRQRERHVVEMTAGDIGVVGDVDVARLHVLDAEMLDLRLHGFGHATNKHGQPDTDRYGLAFRREEAGGEIQGLVDDNIVGGAHEIGLHLFRHRNDSIADDLRDDGIDGGGARARRNLPSFLCH